MNPEKLLPLLFDLGMKSAIVILAALLASLLWRRASAANRHVIWLTLLATLLLLPLTELMNPLWTFFWQQSAKPQPALAVVPPIAPRTELPSIPPGAAIVAKLEQPHSTLTRWTAVGVMTWMSGAALLLLQRAAASWKLGRFVRGRPQISDARLVALARESARGIGVPWEMRESESFGAPLVFGMWRPVILMPAEARDWTDEGLRAALLHEFGHVRRRDCLTRLLMDLACAIYWVNPLVWMAARKMRVAQEQACDDIVLSAGASPTDYASQIVEIVRSVASEHFNSRHALAMAQPSTLETRIRAIVDAGCDRRPVSRPAFAGGTLAILAALALCGAARLRGADEKSVGPDTPQTQTDAKRLTNAGEIPPASDAGNKTGAASEKAAGQQTTPEIAAKPIAGNPEENQVVATVNDRQITAIEVTRAVTRASDRSSAEARKAALEKVIDDALLVQYFRAMHYESPSRFADENVRTIVKEEFKGDEAKFEAVLGEQGFTLETFKKIQEEKIINQLLRRLFSKNVTGPDEKKKAIAAWLAALRAKATITYH